MSIILDNVNYIYGQGEGFTRHALKNINLVIGKNEFIGLIGHTGSGKSTLTQILNGLYTPSSGNVFFDGQDINEKKYDRRLLRQKIGLVFQYPEHQIFESTVFADVCYGPTNMGLSKKEVELRAFEALTLTGFESELFYQSPFTLSGGQLRRVAIAGVLAMKPEILILDEPTAGLDPVGRNDILNTIRTLHEKTGNTVILVSHSMEDIAEYVDRLIVMNAGELIFDGKPEKIFANYDILEEIGLAAPETSYLMQELKAAGLEVDVNAIREADCCNSIMEALNLKGIY